MVQVAVIDYELGNLQSVVNAFEILGVDAKLTNKKEDLQAADGLVLPGVGAFADGMKNLKRLNLISILDELVLRRKKPVLGICLGMQLMAEKSYENGEFDGLGWIKGEVVRFKIEQYNLKVPHVGWNDVHLNQKSKLLAFKDEVLTFYFVHSYHFVCREPSDVIGICTYGKDFTAIVESNNIYGTQFHPEKSQRHGLDLLRNFLNIVQEGDKG